MWLVCGRGVAWQAVVTTGWRTDQQAVVRATILLWCGGLVVVVVVVL